MTRYRFGGDAAAWLVEIVTDATLFDGAEVVALPSDDVDVPFYVSQNGIPISDFLDASQAPLSSVTVPAGSPYLPFFYGPDGVPTLWFQDQDSTWHVLQRSDLGDALADAQDTIADILDGSLPVPGTGGSGTSIQVVRQIASGTAGWGARPTNDPDDYTRWLGTDQPPVGVVSGVQYMMDLDEFLHVPSLLT